MTELLSGTCDRALAPSGSAPEWVHLLNNGRETGRDGRAFDLVNPDALVSAFLAAAIDLPIDYEHQNDKPEAKLNGPVPAAGWIKELKADDTGLWGRVEWTDAARALINKREYRYISPSILYHPKSREIVRLKGAGLVHNPNLHLTALASQETTMPPDVPATKPTAPDPARAAPSLAGLLATLGFATDAPAQDVLRAVLDLLKGALAPSSAAATLSEAMPDFVPDPTRFVPVSALTDLLRDRNAKAATMAERDATARVQDALRRGFITPAMKGWATALCTQDPASFEAFLSQAVPAYAHLGKALSHMSAPPEGRAAVAEGSVADAICEQLGLPAGSLNT